VVVVLVQVKSLAASAKPSSSLSPWIESLVDIHVVSSVHCVSPKSNQAFRTDPPSVFSKCGRTDRYEATMRVTRDPLSLSLPPTQRVQPQYNRCRTLVQAALFLKAHLGNYRKVFWIAQEDIEREFEMRFTKNIRGERKRS